MKTKIKKAFGDITQQMNQLNNNIVRFIKEQPNAKIVVNFLDEANVYECIMSARQTKLDYENGVSYVKPDAWDVIFDSLYISDCVLDVGFYVGERLVKTYFIVGYRPLCSTIDGYWVPQELYFIEWGNNNTVKKLRKYDYPLVNDAYRFVNIAMLSWLNIFLHTYLSDPNVNEKLYNFRVRLFCAGDKILYDFEYCNRID